MRNRWAIPLFLVLGIAIGAGGAGWYARRLAVSWDMGTMYSDELQRAALAGRTLSLLQAERRDEAREVLERELERALVAAERLANEGAWAPFLMLGAGDYLEGLAAAQSYVAARGLDPAHGERAARLREKVCGQLSPNSKFRSSCD